MELKLGLPPVVSPQGAIRALRGTGQAEPRCAPIPPVDLPPGRTVLLPDRGEVFVRDSGGDGPAVLLLHGWMFTADLNWWPVYAPLEEAGYRVIAMDHRGHGRGLRTPDAFRLADCAEDAAALLDVLGIESATAVGYSMGGPIATLLARHHPDRIDRLVLCATALEWRDPLTRALWTTMGGLRLVLGLAPDGLWRMILRTSGLPDTPFTTWMSSELSRGSAGDIAEAGRELSRYDARPWIADEVLTPAAVIVATRDRTVAPGKQRDLAEALGAEVHEVDADHFAVAERRRAFARALLSALEAGDRGRAAVAA